MSHPGQGRVEGGPTVIPAAGPGQLITPVAGEQALQWPKGGSDLIITKLFVNNGWDDGSLSFANI